MHKEGNEPWFILTIKYGLECLLITFTFRVNKRHPGISFLKTSVAHFEANSVLPCYIEIIPVFYRRIKYTYLSG